MTSQLVIFRAFYFFFVPPTLDLNFFPVNQLIKKIWPYDTYYTLNQGRLLHVLVNFDLYQTDQRSDDSAVLFDLILNVESIIFQLNRDGSSWLEPVLS